MRAANQSTKVDAEAPVSSDVNLEDWFVPVAPPFKRRLARTDRPHQFKRLKLILSSEGYERLPATVPTYTNIAAAPSLVPPKRWCDLTGASAPYTDPQTRLRYARAELFSVVRALPEDVVQAHLAVRGAQVVLR